MDKQIVKAAGYARVSTAHQADHGHSLEHQQEQIKAYCAARGWELSQIYVDGGISGASAERPQYQQMFKAAQGGQFAQVVVCNLSRFGRSMVGAIQDIERLAAAGCALVSITENISTNQQDATGKLFLHILSALAEWERQLIKERTHGNRTAKWQQGKARVGHPPYGYQWAEDDNPMVLVPVPGQAQVYQQMVQLYMAGNSFEDIANTLNAEGVPAKRTSWRPGTVGNILRSGTYTGTWVVNKTKFKGTKRSGTKPASDHIELPVTPIIAQAAWDALQARIKNNRGGTKRSPFYEDYWLRGLLRCGVCGAKLQALTIKNKGKGAPKRYYACHWAQCSKKMLAAHGRTSLCPMPCIPAEEVESNVWHGLMTKYTLAGNLDRHIGRLLAPGTSDKQRDKLQKHLYSTKNQLAQQERAEGRVLALLGEETVDSKRVTQMLGKVHGDMQKLAAQVAALEAELADVDKAQEERQALADYAQAHRAELVAIGDQLKRLPTKYRNTFLANSLGSNYIVIRGGKDPVPGKVRKKGWWLLVKNTAPGPSVNALKLLANTGAINLFKTGEP